MSRLPLHPPVTLQPRSTYPTRRVRHRFSARQADSDYACGCHAGTLIPRRHPSRRRQHVLRAGSSDRLSSTAAGNCSFYLQTTSAAPSCSQNT